MAVRKELLRKPRLGVAWVEPRASRRRGENLGVGALAPVSWEARAHRLAQRGDCCACRTPEEGGGAKEGTVAPSWPRRFC